jgi:hypothetical protein
MRWNLGMMRRGLLAFGIALVAVGWGAYAAKEIANDIGRTVAFGLKPHVIGALPIPEILVNRAAKADRFVPVRAEAKKVYFGPYCSFLSNNCLRV